MKKQIIATTIILLFIGVAIAPSINLSVVKASDDNDLVEVTTQACGIKGFGNTTVKLTRQQYQNLEQYLVEFRVRLNQTSTREEAVPIFKEAVVELDKYGLLPKGMSVEKAQQFVTGQYQKIGYEHLIKKPFFRDQMNNSNNSNYLCLVYSATNGTSPVISIGPIVRLIDTVFNLLFLSPGYAIIINYFLYNHSLILYKIYNRIMSLIFVLLLFPSWYGPTITLMNPINILYTITLGIYSDYGYGGYYSYDPAIGWVATFGLKGKRIFQDQPLWGNIPVLPYSFTWTGTSYYYPGIIGFTGFHILPLHKISYHLGSALWVNIGSEPPRNNTFMY